MLKCEPKKAKSGIRKRSKYHPFAFTPQFALSDLSISHQSIHNILFYEWSL